MVEHGVVVLIKGDLCYPPLRSCHVTVFPVHIADNPPSLEGMPEVGVKP